MKGEVGHFEVPADIPKRAQRFYAATFGWKMTEIPGMDYTMVTAGEVNEQGRPKGPGYLGGGLGKRGGMLEHPAFTIMVEEIAEAEKVVEKNGGKILERKKANGDGSMGWTAYFKDSEGNTDGFY